MDFCYNQWRVASWQKIFITPKKFTYNLKKCISSRTQLKKFLDAASFYFVNMISAKLHEKLYFPKICANICILLMNPQSGAFIVKFPKEALVNA
ncbi:hypothetical protein TR09_23830 [Vibrio parahaemolyticus]|nr:hypothetical protein TR09_23830 [Vibrio parahaemolyticus]